MATSPAGFDSLLKRARGGPRQQKLPIEQHTYTHTTWRQQGTDSTQIYILGIFKLYFDFKHTRPGVGLTTAPHRHTQSLAKKAYFAQSTWNVDPLSF